MTITPRNYIFKFRQVNDINSHYAMIGMAYVTDNYPLYYDLIKDQQILMVNS